jgi:multidrug efflux pump subunit AcrB
MSSRYGTDRENHHSFDGAAWCVTIGGVTNGIIYGAPGMPKSMVSTSASSQSYTIESTPPSSSIQALKEQIKEIDDYILSLQ